MTQANLALNSQQDGRFVRWPRDPSFELEQIRLALQGIRYGEVRVIVHNGSIIQIDRLEKQRLPLKIEPFKPSTLASELPFHAIG